MLSHTHISATATAKKSLNFASASLTTFPIADQGVIEISDESFLMISFYCRQFLFPFISYFYYVDRLVLFWCHPWETDYNSLPFIFSFHLLNFSILCCVPDNTCTESNC